MEASITKNTKIHVTVNRSCAIDGCRVETSLVPIRMLHFGLKATIFICKKHR